MRLEKIATLGRKIVVKLGPDSKLVQTIVSSFYIFYLKLSGKYQKRRKSAFAVIEKNVTKAEYKNKRKMQKIYREILFCRLVYRINAREYFTYNFNMLSHNGRKTFITRGNKYPFYKKINNQNYLEYLNMKTETYRKFKEYYLRDVLPMYDESDYSAFLEFIKKHPRFIYKPSDDYGGQGIKIYDINDYSNLEDLFEIIIYNGYCVLEELIKQAEEIARIHPESVNTTRVVAFRKNDGDIIIQWAFFRMGMGGNHTDNMSGGGLGVMVDPETGILSASGRDYLGNDHLFHPDTGVKLIGFQMPEWDNLLKLVKELFSVIPEIRLVGWDLAYTDNGWDLVEANSRPQCLTAQISKHNGRLHQYQEIAKIFDEEMKENERKH